VIATCDGRSYSAGGVYQAAADRAEIAVTWIDEAKMATSCNRPSCRAVAHKVCRYNANTLMVSQGHSSHIPAAGQRLID